MCVRAYAGLGDVPFSSDLFDYPTNGKRVSLEARVVAKEQNDGLSWWLEEWVLIKTLLDLGLVRAAHRAGDRRGGAVGGEAPLVPPWPPRDVASGTGGWLVRIPSTWQPRFHPGETLGARSGRGPLRQVLLAWCLRATLSRTRAHIDSAGLPGGAGAHRPVAGGRHRAPGAMLSVWGTSSTDVWVVGADARDGTGPTVAHFDGERWSHVPTNESQGNLWWVFGFEDGPVYMGGDGGVILRYADGAYTKMVTPGTGTVFGIWGATPDELWAVGGDSAAAGGFAWRLGGDVWTAEPSLPVDVVADAAIWKVFGTHRDDAWLVGSNGVSLRWDGSTLTSGNTGVGSSLFTVHASEGRYVAVGGVGTGFIVENEGEKWVNVTPDPPPPGLSGVALGADDFGVAVGTFGTILTRNADGWRRIELPFPLDSSLHGAWIDESGGAWVVGGQVFAPPYDEGVVLHWGSEVPPDGL